MFVLATFVLNNLLSAATVSSVSLVFQYPSLNVTDSTLFNTFNLKLSSKPDAPTDIFLGSDHNSLIFSDCHKTFDSNNWDIWQEVTVTGVPVFVTGVDSAATASMNIIARGFQGDLKNDTFLPVTRYVAPAQTCTSIGDPHFVLFDGFAVDHQGSGSFYLFDSPQLTIQTSQGVYSSGTTVNKAVAVRYGKSIVVLDVTNDYLSSLKTVQDDGKMSGMIFTPVSTSNHDQVITLPDGSSITLSPKRDSTSSYININLALSAGYPATSGGICNRKDSKGLLWKRDDTSIGRDQVDAFADSWKVPADEDLFQGRLPTSVDPYLINAGQLCTIPEIYTPPVPPPPPTPLPTYVPPPPQPQPTLEPTPLPAPPQDFIKEALATCNKIFEDIKCQGIVDHKPYVDICIADTKTTGDYAIAEATKQSYLSKCHSQTNYMLYNPAPIVAQQATQVQAQLGLGNNTCVKECSNNGQCTNSGCVCKSEFTGSDCSISIAPLITYSPVTQNYSETNPVIVVLLPDYPQVAPQPVSPISLPCTPGALPPPAIKNPTPPPNQLVPISLNPSPSIQAAPSSKLTSSSPSKPVLQSFPTPNPISSSMPSLQSSPSLNSGSDEFSPIFSGEKAINVITSLGIFSLFQLFQLL